MNLQGEQILLHLYVQPRAARNEVVGLHGDALKLRLTTPPVDGKANKAVLAFAAKMFGLPKAQVSLKSGHKNRRKILVLEGIDYQTAMDVLGQYLKIGIESGG